MSPGGDGFYRIISANSGLVVDVADGSDADGANIVQSASADDYSQLWTLSTASAPVGFFRKPAQ